MAAWKERAIIVRASMHMQFCPQGWGGGGVEKLRGIHAYVVLSTRVGGGGIKGDPCICSFVHKGGGGGWRN